MVRKELAKHAPQVVGGFRWRGGEVSRLEGFSDAVFGFALTLLVVSMEVPDSFDELVKTMRGFLAFAACFATLALVWYCHYLYFRRYGLQDAVTISLNFALMFVVMFYVYPLKFLYTLIIGMFSGLAGAPGEMPTVQAGQFQPLMIVYGAGYIAVQVVFILLYLHAYRKREELQLTPLELFDTRAEIGSLMILAGVGVVSILMALTGQPWMITFAGMWYGSIGLWMSLYWSRAGDRRRKVQSRPARS